MFNWESGLSNSAVVFSAVLHGVCFTRAVNFIISELVSCLQMMSPSMEATYSDLDGFAALRNYPS